MIIRQSVYTALLLLVYTNSYATPVIYTSSVDFFNNIPGFYESTDLDFDGLANGTIIESGDIIDGFEFTYLIDGGNYDIEVTDEFPTTSSPNSIGTNDGGFAFLQGDAFNLSFEPSHAIGMQFISGPGLQSGDIQLSVNGTTALLNPDDKVQIGSTDSYAYFLGIIDNMSKSSLASITSGTPPSSFSFNVDDITAVVPSPTIPASLLIASFVGLLFRQRKII